LYPFYYRILYKKHLYFFRLLYYFIFYIFYIFTEISVYLFSQNSIFKLSDYILSHKFIYMLQNIFHLKQYKQNKTVFLNRFKIVNLK